jgi:membrane protein implicated in regulation of membrane protease activity
MENETNIIISALESMNATKWGILGLLLVGLELITGTTYILWPAVAALAMAVLVFFLPLSWELQLVLFFILSTVLLVVGHMYLKPIMKSGEPSDLNDPGRTMLGRRVTAITDFDGGHGRVTVGDTQWKASTDSGDPQIGDALVITAIAGATLIVEPALKA